MDRGQQQRRQSQFARAEYCVVNEKMPARAEFLVFCQNVRLALECVVYETYE